jgi:hypothetical protein
MVAEKRHRLFTRWFNRRIDLGAWLVGCLFILIWCLLPGRPVGEVVSPSLSGMHVQAGWAPLERVPAYLRPDLILVPSRYSYVPALPLGDLAAHVPIYPYPTVLDRIPSFPEGMGNPVDLISGVWGSQPVLLPATASQGTVLKKATDTAAAWVVRMAGDLGSARLRTELPVFRDLRSEAQSWRCSFWITEHMVGGDIVVFIEESSGDRDRDLRLVRIVQRPDVWENLSGNGLVRIRYQPGVGGENADSGN